MTYKNIPTSPNRYEHKSQYHIAELVATQFILDLIKPLKKYKLPPRRFFYWFSGCKHFH
jgi:hypothetical protein